MLSDKKGIVLAVAVLMAITASVPVASASNIHTVLNPKTDSANVTAYVNTTATVKTSGTSLISLLGLLHNSSDTTTVKSGTSMYSSFQGAVSENSSAATIQYLRLEAQTNYTNVSSHEWMMNHSLKIVMNVTGLKHNGSFDMGWRSFTYKKQLVINSTDYNYFNVDGRNTSENASGRLYNSVNFTAFSEPLTNWTKSYNSATNTTTFSKDAGYTLDYVLNLSSKTTGNFLNITVKSDPSYSIVTPGYANANANSISISNPPSSSPYGYVIIAAVVVIVGIGVGVSIAARRRNRRFR